MVFLKGREKQTMSVICVAVCIWSAGGLFMQGCMLTQDPLCERAGKSVQVAGCVTKLEQRENCIRLTIENRESRFLATDYTKTAEAELEEGDWAEFRGMITLPQQRRNPSCFDYRLYLRSCGIQAMMTIEEIRPLRQNAEPYRKLVFNIRNTFTEKIEQYLEPPFSGLGIAMVFGEKETLDEELYEDFQRNGTAHILAVSGMHVGILYSFFSFLWRGRKGSAFYLCVTAVLLLYTALSGCAPSVVRAAVMIFLHLGAEILHRRYDLLSAAAVTFILMLLKNPFQIFHAGFQLSFLAIVSLGVILPFAEKLYQGLFLSSLAIQVGMLPYTAYLFNYISFGAFIANVPVIFLSGLLLPLGILMIPMAYGSGEVFSAAAFLFELGCKTLIEINRIFYMDGAACLDVISPPISILVCYYGILFLLVSEKGRIHFLRKQYRKLAIGIVGVFLLAVFTVPLTEDGFSKAGITFVDVGQGDCIHVRTPEGKHYLIDGGGSARYNIGKNTLKPYLLKNGAAEVEAAFVTHLHEDHYGGIRQLAEEGMIKSIGLYEANSVAEETIRRETGGNTELFYLHGGQTVTLGDKIFLDILAPEKKSRSEYQQLIQNQEDENELSLIMRLRYGKLSVLITGDIDQEGERRLTVDPAVKKRLRCDILKVAHHGSKYSSSDEFLNAALPSIAVFQVGKNNFGHPSETVIEKCRQKGIMVYRNDLSGAIGIQKSGGEREILVQKMIE